jgi:hypothetical protein
MRCKGDSREDEKRSRINELTYGISLANSLLKGASNEGEQ